MIVVRCRIEVGLRDARATIEEYVRTFNLCMTVALASWLIFDLFFFLSLRGYINPGIEPTMFFIRLSLVYVFMFASLALWALAVVVYRLLDRWIGDHVGYILGTQPAWVLKREQDKRTK